MRIKPYTIILGSTGSVGKNAIEVLRKHNSLSKKKIKIIALANLSNKEEIRNQAKELEVEFIYSKENDEITLDEFIKKILKKYKSEDINALNSIAGFSGLEASFALAKYKIDTLLANKETIVTGGDIYLNYAKKQKINVIPVDSEHSAIWSLIKAHKNIKKVIITASGGPFKDRTKEQLKDITVQEAANNPNWKMGKKISIDSATMANKVLEIVEAKYLFCLKKEQIDVVINKESFVHSIVELKNNSLYLEMSTPDMKLPISKAYSLKKEAFIKPVDFSALSLNFSKVDASRFEFLSLVDILLSHESACIVFNAADEMAVNAFEKGLIGFTEIFKVVKMTMDCYRFENIKVNRVEDIYNIDKDARLKADYILSSSF